MSCCTQWDASERKVVQDGNRQHYRNLVKKYGGVAFVPGFRESLKRLFEQGYSQVDVAAFLGISRERVRQLVEIHGIDSGPKGARPRIWDDLRNRFVAISKDEYKRVVVDAKAGRELHARVVDLLDAMVAEGERCGQIPGVRTWQEVAPASGLPSHSDYYDYFGSWGNALWLSGLIGDPASSRTGSPGHRNGCGCGSCGWPSSEERIEQLCLHLVAIAEQEGRHPKIRDLESRPSCGGPGRHYKKGYSYSTYRRHFGSWRNALDVAGLLDDVA